MATPEDIVAAADAYPNDMWNRFMERQEAFLKDHLHLRETHELAYYPRREESTRKMADLIRQPEMPTEGPSVALHQTIALLPKDRQHPIPEEEAQAKYPHIVIQWQLDWRHFHRS